MWCVQVKSILVWVGNGIQTFYPSMFTVRCYGRIKIKEDYERICNDLFASIYRVLFAEEAPCLSPKGQKIVKAYGDYYITLDGVYIGISGSTKAPQFYKTHHYFRRLLINLMWMVWLLHFTKLKRVFDLLFPYQQDFIELKTLSRPKKKLVFCPPSYSKRSNFRRDDPKGNLMNICNMCASHGVMIMNTYWLGN